MLRRAALTTLACLGLACGAETSPDADADAAARPTPVRAAAAAVEEVPAWTVTGSMTWARQLFVSARLPEGAVLVAGGWRVGSVDTGNVYFASAELYDPATGQFTLLPSPMSKKRVQHAAAPLPDGRVLVAGGYGDADSATTADLFVPSAQKFEPAPALAHARIAATLTLLADARVLAAGGDEAPGGTAELLDLAAMTWTETALMVVPRRSHTATLLADGRVLVTGGERRDAAFHPTDTAELFDPATATWKAAAPMSVARASHTATLLASGAVLVAGGVTEPAGAAFGASAELFDPETGTWTPLPPMHAARSRHTATLLESGAVLVAGGVDETSSVLRSAELFDLETLRWVPVGLMSHGRLAHTAVLLEDGAVLAAGGEHQSSAEIYRPAPDDQPCEVATQCASGFCVDAVCCDAACTGACTTCALPGAEGTCSPAAPGTDPHLDCGAGGACDDVCDETGACADRVGEVCIAPACDADGTHALLAATCAEPGGACAETFVDCAPYRCGATSSGEPGCIDRCASIDDCAAGYACDPSGRCRSRPDVAAADPEACAITAGPAAALSPEKRTPPVPTSLAAVLLATLAAVLRARHRRSS